MSSGVGFDATITRNSGSCRNRKQRARCGKSAAWFYKERRLRAGVYGMQPTKASLVAQLSTSSVAMKPSGKPETQSNTTTAGNRPQAEPGKKSAIKPFIMAMT
jgi:hypothetical protein